MATTSMITDFFKPSPLHPIWPRPHPDTATPPLKQPVGRPRKQQRLGPEAEKRVMAANTRDRGLLQMDATDDPPSGVEDRVQYSQDKPTDGNQDSVENRRSENDAAAANAPSPGR